MAINRIHTDYVRWQNGESLQGMTGAQLRDLAAEVQRQHGAAYVDPKHRDHQFISESIAELHQLSVARTPAGETPV